MLSVTTVPWRRHLRTKAKGRRGVVCRLNCEIHVWAPWGRVTCHLGRYINPRTFTFTSGSQEMADKTFFIFQWVFYDFLLVCQQYLFYIFYFRNLSDQLNISKMCVVKCMRVISHLYSDLTSGLCQHIPYLIRSRVFYRLTQQTSNSSKKMLDAYKKTRAQRRHYHWSETDTTSVRVTNKCYCSAPSNLLGSFIIIIINRSLSVTLLFLWVSAKLFCFELSEALTRGQD